MWADADGSGYETGDEEDGTALILRLDTLSQTDVNMFTTQTLVP